MSIKIYKTINPCKCQVYTRAGSQLLRNAFARIEFDGTRLSITGVIAPMSDGNSLGSAGQCADEMRLGTPTDKWTDEMLQKFCDIWDRWNDNMRPYCSHMKELGWLDERNEKIKVEDWTLSQESMNKRSAAEKRALSCLKKGETFIPTKEETMYANLSYSLKIYNEEDNPLKQYYALRTKDNENGLEHSCTHYETRGLINYKDNPLGLLCKPCPVCGYEYGSSWLTEEVPEDVIEWLSNLPRTTVKPAWI